MALWTFHNNPGIGGFGESTPVLSGSAGIHTNAGRRRLERTKQSDCEKQKPNGINVPQTVSNKHSNGEGDLFCQIVKELVDNAVDACRSPLSERDDSEDENLRRNHKKRIRVDIRPFSTGDTFSEVFTAVCRSKGDRDDVLQLTVTDTGCGMKNIQNCVNAFQSSKDGGDRVSNDFNNNSNIATKISSGRYGIGLTLCLLHAQRCVPNSRACISSVTPKSKIRTRAFFEVDKQEDLVKCVQEEIVHLSSSETESGTCVSLLVPGGDAASLAWPRLKEYFIRFRLCTDLQFELDVFAPTLSKLPIYIRPRKIGKLDLKTCERAVEIETSQDSHNSDEWEDLSDCDNREEEKSYMDTDALINKQEWDESFDGETDSHRYDFVNAVRSFWPNRNTTYDNVAWSVRKIRKYNDETQSTAKEANEKSEAYLEVNMAVCPHSNQDENCNSSVESAATSDILSGEEKAATLQLVRIVNGVPIIESAEAHSCGIVHGIANKRVWASFGLDIDRSTATASDNTVCAPSFTLRDSPLIASFFNKSLNHKQLRTNDNDTIQNQSLEANKKKRKREILPQKDLLPANARIGAILIVVHVRAAPSSLPLPTLSKGRLPLNHQPIDSALQLGLRDCIASLRSTNPALFLTSSLLRTAERDVRYIPGIASAVSRIVCRSRNQLLRRKSLELFPNALINCDQMRSASFETSTPTKQEHEGKDSQVSLLADAFESRLRLAIKTRNESMNKRRRKKQSCSSQKDEEFHDFYSDKENQNGDESFQVQITNDSGSNSLSSSSFGQRKLEIGSSFSFHSQSSRLFSVHQHLGRDSHEEAMPPMTEIVIDNRPTHPTNEEEQSFYDCF